MAPALGVTCFAGDLGTAARLVVQRAISGRGGYACLGNAHVLVSAHHDPDLRRALDDAWKVFPDGAPVAWLQRRLGSRAAERIGGPDLMPRVCGEGNALNVRHFLLGSTNNVLVRLQRNLERDYPGIAIVGSYSPSRNEIEGDVRALSSELAQVTRRSSGAHSERRARSSGWPGRGGTPVESDGRCWRGFRLHRRDQATRPQWMQRAGLEWASSPCGRAETPFGPVPADKQRVRLAGFSADPERPDYMTLSTSPPAFGRWERPPRTGDTAPPTDRLLADDGRCRSGAGRHRRAVDQNARSPRSDFC